MVQFDLTARQNDLQIESLIHPDCIGLGLFFRLTMILSENRVPLFGIMV